MPATCYFLVVFAPETALACAWGWPEECSAPDTAASGPAHTAMVAATAHRKPAAAMRQVGVLMAHTLNPEHVGRAKEG